MNEYSATTTGRLRPAARWALALVATILVAGTMVVARAAATTPQPQPSPPSSSRWAAPGVEVQRAALAADEPVAEPSPTPSPSPSVTSTPGDTPSTTPSPTATPEPAPTPSAAPSASPAPAPTPTAPATTPSSGPDAVLQGGPAALALVGAPGSTTTYLPAGQPLADLLPFQAFRVVVQLANPGSVDIVAQPRVEYRAAGSGAFQVVPDEAAPGVPLHAAPEWVPAKGGTRVSPEAVTTPAGDARLPAPPGTRPAAGHRSSGAGTAPLLTLPAGTVTEQEFTLALSVDAPYQTGYELRVTDAGRPVPGLDVARVTVASAPRTLLSPGQRRGAAPDGEPAGVQPAYRLVSEPSTVAASATNRALFLVAADTPTDPTTVGPAGPATIHDPYSSTTSGQCGVCHQTHTARSGAIVKATSTTEQCYTCHAGGVGGPDVQAQYTLGQPANDPATRSYWSHDTADPTGHTLDTDNEFAGRLERHSQCTDCHDPHGTTSSAPTMTSAGWTLPGGLANVSGVAVTNGAAGTAPTYTWLDGTVAPVTAEYQLCFKCHSGYTTLPTNVPGKPSLDVTDLGVALNPANASYHPIEAPGRNQTQKLADSLAGTSPYKLWNFTTGDTVRCVSCHSSNTTGTSPDPAQNLPDATSTVHASTNRGILTRPYENRVLSAAGRFYDNTGFALCLTCHMETPFMNRFRPAAAEGTNFVFHGLHMSGISGDGSGGLDIDTPGAGQGNARCAECHFDDHGTTQAPGTQKVSGDRLVVFAPDVLPSKSMGGVPTFTKTATGGSCMLTCHGKDHQGATYTS
jgi:predicted CXXCH cytochrome family protein